MPPPDFGLPYRSALEACAAARAAGLGARAEALQAVAESWRATYGNAPQSADAILVAHRLGQSTYALTEITERIAAVETITAGATEAVRVAGRAADGKVTFTLQTVTLGLAGAAPLVLEFENEEFDLDFEPVDVSVDREGGYDANYAPVSGLPECALVRVAARLGCAADDLRDREVNWTLLPAEDDSPAADEPHDYAYDEM